MKILKSLLLALLAALIASCGKPSAESAKPEKARATAKLTPDEKADRNQDIALAKNYLLQQRSFDASLTPEETKFLHEAFARMKAGQKSDGGLNDYKHACRAAQARALGYDPLLQLSIEDVIRHLRDGRDPDEAKKYLIHKSESLDDNYRVQNIVDDYVIYINRSNRQIAVIKRPGATHITNAPFSDSPYAFVGLAEFSRTFGGQSQLPVFEDKADDIRKLKLIE